MASVISDMDLLIPSLEHRGPTHSLIAISLLFLPLFMLYGKRAAPYFIGTIQHSLLGDFVAGGGGVQLLWPATVQAYGIGFEITSVINILTEWTFFLMSLTIMHTTRDTWTLFQHHSSNLLLSIPVFTVLLPTLLSFPLSVPPELVIPHLIYLTIFTLSILTDLKPSLK